MVSDPVDRCLSFDWNISFKIAGFIYNANVVNGSLQGKIFADRPSSGSIDEDYDAQSIDISLDCTEQWFSLTTKTISPVAASCWVHCALRELRWCLGLDMSLPP